MFCELMAHTLIDTIFCSSQLRFCIYDIEHILHKPGTVKCTLQNFERTVQIVVHQQPRIYEAFPGSGKSIGVKCIAGFEKQVLTF